MFFFALKVQGALVLYYTQQHVSDSLCVSVNYLVIVSGRDMQRIQEIKWQYNPHLLSRSLGAL